RPVTRYKGSCCNLRHDASQRLCLNRRRFSAAEPGNRLSTFVCAAWKHRLRAGAANLDKHCLSSFSFIFRLTSNRVDEHLCLGISDVEPMRLRSADAPKDSVGRRKEVWRDHQCFRAIQIHVNKIAGCLSENYADI